MAGVAGVAPLTKQELASKLVQEIAEKGDEIPEDFFRKDGFPEAIDAPDLWRGELLIDFSLLSLYSAPELTKLESALSKWGCFQVINHGIEVSFLEELIKTAKQFFALPLEEKLKYTAADDITQGYGTDSAYSGSQIRNWNDRLLLFLHPEERLRLECWPQKPEKFREMIEEYLQKISTVNKVLCKAMSRSLGLEENCLEFGKHGPAVARFNHYPRCPYPELILGTKPHTDNGMITYLFPEVEGLQILNDGQWYKVPVIPGALFINLGELGEVSFLSEDFLRKDGIPKAIDAPDLWRGDLLIDFSLLSSYSAPELAKLKSALSKWGCFQVIKLVSFQPLLSVLSFREFLDKPLFTPLTCKLFELSFSFTAPDLLLELNS